MALEVKFYRKEILFGMMDLLTDIEISEGGLDWFLGFMPW